MPSYKLCYFNTQGLAEMSRLLFAEAGVPFEDVRYSREEWPQHKPNMVFNTIPVLFVDGEQIGNSRAILRYLAREFRLDGGDSLTAAKVDMWIEAIFEVLWRLPVTEQDETKKAELSEIAFSDYIVPRFKQLEEWITKNKGMYVFGDTITALDILIYVTCDLSKKFGFEKHLENFPKIQALREIVQARPNIAKWLAERPDTQ